VVLEIPSGTFAENASLTVRKLGKPQIGKPGLMPAGPVYEFDIGAEKLKNPVKVKIRFNESSLKGIDLRKLGVYRQDDKKYNVWNYVGGILDTKAGTVQAALKGSGSYAVMVYSGPMTLLPGKRWPRCLLMPWPRLSRPMVTWLTG